jgi:hypothetical protein
VWWITTVISALRRLREEELKVEASLHYLPRPCLTKRIKKKKRKPQLLSFTTWLIDMPGPPYLSSVYVSPWESLWKPRVCSPLSF